MKSFFKNLKARFEQISDPNDAQMALSKKNYVLLIIGAVVIVLGMALMVGT